MIHFLTFGTVLGLSAGFAPGPLLALVISETLENNIKAGIKVALAPIVTDLPIILLTIYVLSKLSHFHTILGVISLVGGGVILKMGYQSLKTQGVTINGQQREPHSLIKGVIVNILSPHPYLFWLTIGAPTMTRAMDQNIAAPLAFLASFYFFLVGSKILLAILAGKSRSILQGKLYIYTMRLLGLMLCLLAMVLFYDGLQLLNVVHAQEFPG